MKRHIITIIALLFITCLTRIPFVTKCICTHDSANFALAIENFDIAKHQPHPPGYILYIGLAKFINLFVQNANKSLIILSIVFSVISVILIYLLGKKMFNYRCGLASALFLMSSPLFWAYGELALSYTVDTLGSLLVAYTGYHILKTKRKYTLLSIVLGLVAGIRQTLLFFLLPLWLRVFISPKPSKERIKQIFVLAIVCLAWIIPLIILSGGLIGYRNASQQLYEGSVFGQVKSFKTVVYAGCSSLWGLGMAILGLFVSIRRLLAGKITCLSKKILIFLALSGGPAILFCFIFYIGKPGYILVFLPFLVLLSSIFVYKQWGVIEHILVGVIVVGNCLLFFTVRPLSAGEQLMGINTDRIKNFANFWVLEYSNKGLRQKEQIKETFDSIRKNFLPEKAVICVVNRENFQPYIPWRAIYYYIPEFPIVKIENEFQLIKLNTEIETIIWLVDKEDLKRYKNINLNKVVMDNGEDIYFSNIKDTLTIEKFKFYKEK